MALSAGTPNGGNATAGATQIDITLTVASGLPAIWVMVASNDTPVWGTPPRCRWDSAGVNEVFDGGDDTPIAITVGTGLAAALYRKTNPTPGSAKNLRITGLSSSVRDMAVAFPFNGVDQATPNGTVDKVEANPGGATQDSGAIVCAAGNFIFSGFANTGTVSATPTADGNAVTFHQDSGASNGRVDVWIDTAGANNTITWDQKGGSKPSIFSFEIKADTGGAVGQPAIRRFGLMAVGHNLHNIGRSGGAVMRDGWTRRRSGIVVPSRFREAA